MVLAREKARDDAHIITTFSSDPKDTHKLIEDRAKIDHGITTTPAPT
jgi:hypothetical protein